MGRVAGDDVRSVIRADMAMNGGSIRETSEETVLADHEDDAVGDGDS